nr:MAG TPA: hypothetical protein [Caudoviricetes sp.]
MTRSARSSPFIYSYKYTFMLITYTYSLLLDYNALVYYYISFVARAINFTTGAVLPRVIRWSDICSAKSATIGG